MMKCEECGYKFHFDGENIIEPDVAWDPEEKKCLCFTCSDAAAEGRDLADKEHGSHDDGEEEDLREG